MKVKEESEKVGLKSTFRKQRSWHQFHHFMANRWGNNGNSAEFTLGASKITANGDCMKLKDACSLEEKL